MLPIILVGVATLYLSGIFGNSIPSFTGERLDGRTYTKENLRPDLPVVFCYIDVMCEECKELVRQIIAHEESFKSTQVIIISPQESIMIGGFQNNFELKKYPFITILNDRFKNFDTVIKAQRFPTALVYGKSHNLLRRYDNLNTKSQVEEAVKQMIELLKK